MYTQQEVAQILKITVGEVERLIESGELKAALVGQERKVKKEDLDAYISRQLHPGG